MAHPEHRLSPAELRQRLQALPTLPALVSDILASFEHDNLDVATLGRRIAADQGVLARTLRIANSSFYGVSGDVVSIEHAIMVLGFRTVRSLVLAASLVGIFGSNACRAFSTERFWQHSVAVAVLGRRVARLCGRNPEAAFTAGLLHDLGRYVLAVCFPAAYQAVLEYQQAQGCLCQDAERAVLGVDHMQAGGVLAELWSLPAPLAAAMSGHHAPVGSADAEVVHVADILAHALQLDPDATTLVPRLDVAVWQRLALGDDALLGLFAVIETEFRETCHALIS